MTIVLSFVGRIDADAHLEVDRLFRFGVGRFYVRVHSRRYAARNAGNLKDLFAGQPEGRSIGRLRPRPRRRMSRLRRFYA